MFDLCTPAIMYRLVQLLLLFTFINYSLCNCMEKLERCDKTFQDEIKGIKFNTAEFMTIYSDICSKDGIYNKFVNCVQQLQGQCDKSPKFRQQICHTRALKMNSYRYTWKYNLIHDVCYRSSPILDSEFFKHEKCISRILNSPRWQCDEAHYKLVKQTNGPKSCPHWDDFRKCTYETVSLECGANAANVSDYLFHAHGSYFTKYTSCNLPGVPFTKCWYDSLVEQMQPASSTTKSVSTTQQSASSTEWVESSMKPDRSPKEQHTTFVSVQSNEHSNVETTEWNKVYSTTINSNESSNKKENTVDNDESSYLVVEDNSIHHEEKHEEKHEEDEEDDDSDHEDKHSNDTEDVFNDEKKKTRKNAHTNLIQSTLSSINKELYQNDSDPKTNGTLEQDEASGNKSDKSSLQVRESKNPVTEASHKETLNLTGFVGNQQQEKVVGLQKGQEGRVEMGSGNGASSLSALLAILISLLTLTILSA